jgi:hypothetical protein
MAVDAFPSTLRLEHAYELYRNVYKLAQAQVQEANGPVDLGENHGPSVRCSAALAVESKKEKKRLRG